MVRILFFMSFHLIFWLKTLFQNAVLCPVPLTVRGMGLEPPPAGADKTVKMHPTDIPWYDYIGRKDPATGEVTCPWRRGRGKVPSGGSSGVQMAG